MGLVLALPILAEFIRIMPPLQRIVGPVLVVSLLQAWYPPLSEIWNYPAWSLSVEVLFYASFPLLFSVFSSWSRRSLFFAAYGLVLISALARAGMTDVLSTHFPLYHLPLFMFGMVLGRQFPFGRQPSTSWHGTIFAAGILVAVAVFGFRSLPSWTRSDAVLVVAFSLIIFGAARPAGAMTMLAVPAMVLLGEGSYSIYILHVPLRVWWDGLGLRLPLSLNLVLYIVLLVAFSILSFRCIEIPMSKRIAQLGRARLATAEAGTALVSARIVTCSKTMTRQLSLGLTGLFLLPQSLAISGAWPSRTLQMLGLSRRGAEPADAGAETPDDARSAPAFRRTSAWYGSCRCQPNAKSTSSPLLSRSPLLAGPRQNGKTVRTGDGVCVAAIEQSSDVGAGRRIMLQDRPGANDAVRHELRRLAGMARPET
jgi:hypothetical protein